MFRYNLDQLAQQSTVIESDKKALPVEEERQLFQEKADALRSQIVGGEQRVRTPFGERKLTYCDFTASGKPIESVERYMKEQVLPLYGNTHTLTTATARQTTFFRSEARTICRHFLNCCPIRDALIFCPNGTTGAVTKYVRILEESVLVAGKSSSSKLDTCVDVQDHMGKYFHEDRWGSVECKLCDLRLKNESQFRAHVQTPLHLQRHNAKATSSSRSSEKHEGGETSPKSDNAEEQLKLIFFLDPYAHHSSSLPFRELAKKYPGEVEVVETAETGAGFSDALCAAMEERSSTNAKRIAILSAASNVTGARRDIPLLTQTLHTRFNATVAWDFAALAAHAKVDLNPRNIANADIDVAFFSPHKFLGGPGTSGLLAIKKNHCQNAIPAVPGGGNVFFVTAEDHSYIQNTEEREEAGTPNIVADIRTGLCYRVHQQLNMAMVEQKEAEMFQKVLKAWESVPALEVLNDWNLHQSGIPDFEQYTKSHVPIISFNIRMPISKSRKDSLYLHHNYVSCILNDVFGVQSRGGCACAGPYAQQLLGMDQALSKRFDVALQKFGTEVIRPGFCRVGLHFTMSDEELDLLIESIKWVCEHGWKLLPFYTFDVESGEWEHVDEDHQKKRRWLTDMDTFGTKVVKKPKTCADPNKIQENSPIDQLIHTLETGKAERQAAKKNSENGEDEIETLFAEANGILKERTPATNKAWPVLDSRVADLVWFALPQDVASQRAEKAEVEPEYVMKNGNRAYKPAQVAKPGSQKSTAELIFGDSTVVRPTAPCFSCVDEDSKKFLVQFANNHAPAESTPTAAASSSKKPEPQTVQAKADDAFGDMFEGFDMYEGEDAENTALNPQDPEHASSLKKYAASALNPDIPKTLKATVGQAMKDFEMIKPGDRILIGLSGGKDSMTLLHVLRYFQKVVPFEFDIAAATVNPETPEYDPSPLIDYMAELDVPYHFLCKPLIQLAKEIMNPKKPSICSFCARMKRGMLYTCMKENNYNVLILGQHLDDLAESFLMSAFHNGALRTMKANYTAEQDDADIRICRPLVYTREKTMYKFAEDNQLPIISDNCPACFSQPKERHRLKLLLAKEEYEFHDLFSNLMKAMQPLMALSHARMEDDPFVMSKKKGVSEKVLAGRKKHGIEDDEVEVVKFEERGFAGMAGTNTPAAQKEYKKKQGTGKHGNVFIERDEKTDVVKVMELGGGAEETADFVAEQVLTKCGVDGVCKLPKRK